MRHTSKEETGLKATFDRIVSVEETIFPQINDMETVAHTVNICCLVKVKNWENIQLNDLYASYKWVSHFEKHFHEGVKNPMKIFGFEVM